MSRKKTIEQHKQQGTFRALRHGGKAALTFPPGAACPAWLDAEARKEWRRVAPLLEAQKILQESDKQILAAYCQSYSNWRRESTVLAVEGTILTVTSTTRTGRTQKPIRNPRLQVVLDYQRAMLASAKLFGLDPLTRGRIEAPLAEDDPGDEQQNEGNNDGWFESITATRKAAASKR